MSETFVGVVSGRLYFKTKLIVSPVAPLGNAMPSKDDTVGAISAIRVRSFVLPLFIPFPKNISGTCVSYVSGEPCVEPVFG